VSLDPPSIAAASELRGLPRLTWPWTAVGLACLAGALCIGVLVGPVRISPGEAAQALISGLHVQGAAGLSDPGRASILWSLRLPRVVLGAIVGGMLATAGAAYQGVFRNPLADPYLLGAAAGAELGATLAIAFLATASAALVNLVPVAAFTGATLAVGAAYLVGRSFSGSRSPTTLILAGVAIASFLNAVQIYVQQSQTNSFRQVYTWILGRLVTAGWDGVALIAPYVGLSLIVIFAHRRLLVVLGVGDEEAASLGVSARRVRMVVVAAATLGTAAAVAIAGTIAFVGIIVPHTIRLLVGRSYRVVVPLSMLGGAAFLVLADAAARTVSSPAEVPIGVITALVGAPFFIAVMRSTRTAEL